MKELQEFMLIFRFQPNNEYQPSAEEQAAMHQEWGKFIGGIAGHGNLVSTHKLGFNGSQISADKSVSEGINVSEGHTLGGNLILKAESLDAAIEMGKGCPILAMGGSVEVRDITPM